MEKKFTVDSYLEILTATMDAHPELESKLSDLIAARRSKKQPQDAGSRFDIGRELPMTSEQARYRETATKGMYAPDDAGDFVPGRIEERLDLTQGLKLPDEQPALTGEALKMAETYNRLQALFFEKPVSGLTPAEKRQRAIIERARLEEIGR